MTTLFPPNYPYCPDAPLLSFGPSFAQEIARSVVAAVVRIDEEQPHETSVTVAAALTMLEAFHPRDQLECMMAAQGVGTHNAIMESFRSALLPSTEVSAAVKLRSNATQMMRAFSLLMHDLERRQARPLPERPPEPPPPAVEPVQPPDANLSGRKRSPDPEDMPDPDDLPDLEDMPDGDDMPDLDDMPDPDDMPDLDDMSDLDDMPADVVIRPDGTPGSLAAYLPRKPEVTFVPRESAMQLALATRPKPWRMVGGHEHTAEEGQPPPIEPEHRFIGTHGPLNFPEKMFTGDSLARFASARFDPDAPPPSFEDDEAETEIEIIDTGGDPEAEADRAAIMAAHPDGKPIVTIRYGQKPPAKETPKDG